MNRTIRRCSFPCPCLALFGVVFLSFHAFAATEGSFQRTLAVNGPVNLEVETGSGNVTVHTGPSNQVRVTGHIRAGSWMDDDSAEDKVKKIEANPPIQQSGNDIRVGHIDDPELRRHISISYDITVPESTELHSHTGSGEQDVAGLKGLVEIGSGSGTLKATDIGDSLRAQTGSGNLDVQRVKCNVHARTGSGTIRASEIAGGFEGETGSGDITLQQTAAGSVRAHTGSGGLELHIVSGSLDAQTGSGSIHVDGDPTGTWTLHTGSGSVHMKLAASAHYDLHAHTGSGSLTVDEPIAIQGNIEKKDIRGKVHGGGVPVNVETGSGDILIQ